MLTIIPLQFWCILILLILAYAQLGILGVIGVAVMGLTARNFH